MTSADFHRMVERLAEGDESVLPVARMCLRRIADEGSTKEVLVMLRGVQAIMNFKPAEPVGTVHVITPSKQLRKIKKLTDFLKLPSPPSIQG